MLYSSNASLPPVPAEISPADLGFQSHLGLTFATAKNVINFLNTAVDLLLRRSGGPQETRLRAAIMECIIASVFTRGLLQEEPPPPVRKNTVE